MGHEEVEDYEKWHFLVLVSLSATMVRSVMPAGVAAAAQHWYCSLGYESWEEVGDVFVQ